MTTKKRPPRTKHGDGTARNKPLGYYAFKLPQEQKDWLERKTEEESRRVQRPLTIAEYLRRKFEQEMLAERAARIAAAKPAAPGVLSGAMPGIPLPKASGA